ncbi:hypothetical protein [Leptospira interrogans]|uniref:hypothetical protein n=1 Tax=Leptospira interrogans TaxID=173 RepID=UPI001F106264|nr:hypothetical protein [Leptospira interrogans]UMQ60586.1 hypothetical protein FH585_21355 [Leptospira interrogans]
MSPDIHQKIQYNQSDMLKSEVLLTSAERAGLNLKAGSDPLFIRESDTGRILFWTGYVGLMS